MISEHILRKPSRNIRKHSRAQIISCVGIETKVGVTHFVLLAAHHLVKKRFKVAVVECNNSGDYGRIEQAYEGNREPSHNESFKEKGVCYYKNIGRETLMKIYQEPFDVVILDVGCGLGAFREEILRADQQVFIGYYNEWRGCHFDRFIKENEDIIKKQSKWLVNLGEEEAVRIIKKLTGNRSWGLPYIGDPFIRSKETSKLLNQILGEI